MSPAEERDALIEATLTAFRERNASGRVLPSPAWADLSPADREAAFDAQTAARRLEASHDPRGWNATVHAILGRARRLSQMLPGS